MGGTVARLNVPVGRLAADGHAFPPAGKRLFPPGAATGGSPRARAASADGEPRKGPEAGGGV